MRQAILTAAVALTALLPGAAVSASGAQPKTLVLANGPIAAFAQDGDRVAWASVEPGKACPWLVRVRVLTARKQDALNTRAGRTCKSETGFELDHPTYLALAGERALWTLKDIGNNTYVQLMTGALSAKPDVQLEELVFSNAFGDGSHLGGIAGDGSTLVYGTVRASIQGPPDCDWNGTCQTVVSGGGVKRVAGGAAVQVPQAPPPAALAASGRRIALLAAGVAGPQISPAPSRKVEVRDVIGGRLIGAFLAGGAPEALALSPAFVALLVSTPGGKHIERYSHAGALLGTTPVPTGATGLSATSSRVVFRVGNSIRLLNVTSGTVTRLTTAKATPIGLSIEGTRVAWAENVTLSGKLRGRIEAVGVVLI